MALLYIDGFDALSDYNDLQERGWVLKTAVYSYLSSTTRNSVGKSLRLDSVDISAARVFPEAATVYVGFALLMGGLPGSTRGLFEVGYGGRPHIAIQINADGTLRAMATTSGEIGQATAAGTVLATSVNALSAGVWYYIELKAVCSDTVGVIELRVDGSNTGWFNLTSQDTNRMTAPLSTNINAVAVYCANNTGDGFLFDDLYIASGTGGSVTTFLGDVEVRTILPSTGNGSNTDFTLSTGTDHGAVVDDATPNDDTDYSYSSTLNHVETLNYPALGVTGTVYGVQLVPHLKRSAAGVRGFAGVCRISSTNYVNGTTQYPSTSYRGIPVLYETSPATSSAWTVSEIDGAEFGVKVTA